MEIKKAIQQAEDFLVGRQSPAGSWNDYDLAPGQGLGWVTAYVGFCLSATPSSERNLRPIRAAVQALQVLSTSGGWGYNSRTAPDGDSTAWALRFLARLDSLKKLAPVLLLEKYLLEDGSARTFADQENFGAWAAAHQDVTPVVGLALLECGAGQALLDRIRQAVLRAWDEKKSWQAFWWQDPAYAWARNLEFLDACGRIPPRIAQKARQWIDSRRLEPNAFDVAQVICAASLLGEASGASGGVYIERLLSMQARDGGWPCSQALKVPPQHPGREPGRVCADQNRLMSTASAVLALKGVLKTGTSN